MILREEDLLANIDGAWSRVLDLPDAVVVTVESARGPEICVLLAGPGGGACAVTLNREDCGNVRLTGENLPALSFYRGEFIHELVSHATRQVVFDLIQRFARGEHLG